MIAAVLIGRKWSKGFPGKNLYPVLGKPFAYYPMKAAGECAGIDKFFISTDDEVLMDLAKENGFELIKRPPELCTDKALGEDVYLHAYETIKKKFKDIEMIVLLMCNAATITSKAISEGIAALKKHPEYDSAVSVSKYNMWSPLRARRVCADGLLHPFVALEALGAKGDLNCDRDSQGDVWFADMGVSVVRPRCFEDMENGMLPQKWMGKKIYPIKQIGGLDVDYEWQVPQVERWLRDNLDIRG